VGLEFNNMPITDFITKHLLHICVASILWGFFLTSYAYIQSFYSPFSTLNVHAIGKNTVYAFFIGREVNPRVFGLLDLKIYTIRLTLLGCILLNFVYLYASLDWTTTPEITTLNLKSLNPTLLVLVVIQLIYFLDPLIYESTLLSTFEIQYEGYGYMGGLGYCGYPFMAIQLTKYVADYHVQLATWQLILWTIMFALGYTIYRASNNQKDAFRKNPYDPALSHLETIPTTKGKKLLCSGFWGLVRHPNYLGDILLTASLGAFGWNVPPVLPFVGSILLLIHRTVRDNERCKQKYGAAWDRYCSKVKYVLIPKVY
jgi:lamin-B receptor